MNTEAPAIESIGAPECAHLQTEPAAQPRWRWCKGCGRLVHRSETADYARVTR